MVEYPFTVLPLVGFEFARFGATRGGNGQKVTDGISLVPEETIPQLLG